MNRSAVTETITVTNEYAPAVIRKYALAESTKLARVVANGAAAVYAEGTRTTTLCLLEYGLVIRSGDVAECTTCIVPGYGVVALNNGDTSAQFDWSAPYCGWDMTDATLSGRRIFVGPNSVDMTPRQRAQLCPRVDADGTIADTSTSALSHSRCALVWMFMVEDEACNQCVMAVPISGKSTQIIGPKCGGVAVENVLCVATDRRKYPTAYSKHDYSIRTADLRNGGPSTYTNMDVDDLYVDADGSIVTTVLDCRCRCKCDRINSCRCGDGFTADATTGVRPCSNYATKYTYIVNNHPRVPLYAREMLERKDPDAYAREYGRDGPTIEALIACADGFGVSSNSVQVIDDAITTLRRVDLLVNHGGAVTNVFAWTLPCHTYRESGPEYVTIHTRRAW